MEKVRQMGVIGTTHLFQEWGAFDHIHEEGAIPSAGLGQQLEAETTLIGVPGLYVCRHGPLLKKTPLEP
jgi:hypothetical protein